MHYYINKCLINQVVSTCLQIFSLKDRYSWNKLVISEGFVDKQPQQIARSSPTVANTDGFVKSKISSHSAVSNVVFVHFFDSSEQKA